MSYGCALKCGDVVVNARTGEIATVIWADVVTVLVEMADRRRTHWAHEDVICAGGVAHA